jgi:hypothetical protein
MLASSSLGIKHKGRGYGHVKIYDSVKVEQELEDCDGRSSGKNPGGIKDQIYVALYMADRRHSHSALAIVPIERAHSGHSHRRSLIVAIFIDALA